VEAGFCFCWFGVCDIFLSRFGFLVVFKSVIFNQSVVVVVLVL